jgi:MYXO-CTERM domain-containing protein
MKSIVKILAVSAAALITTTVAQAAPVTLNYDGSTEGYATSSHTPLASGSIEIGWLAAGTTQAQIQALAAANDLAGIDALFNTVSTLNFSSGSPNSFGDGLVFESFQLVADGDSAGLAAYKNATTGAAGETVFAWIRDGSNSAMAFVNTTGVFGLANDTATFTDFETNVATDATVILSSSNVWVGNLVPVTPGGAVDTNGGSPADGFGLNGGPNVIQLADLVAVPEPGTALFGAFALAGLAFTRRRAVRLA